MAPVYEAICISELDDVEVIKAIVLSEDVRGEEAIRDAIEASLLRTHGEEAVDRWTNAGRGPGRQFRRAC
jgi:hypothetical protein